MKTAKQYYARFINKNFTGLIRGSGSCSRHHQIDEYRETGSKRIIEYTQYEDDFDEVMIYPNYQYMENYILGDNTGSRIDRFSLSDLSVVDRMAFWDGIEQADDLKELLANQ